MLNFLRTFILLFALSLATPLVSHASIQNKQIRITRATGIFAESLISETVKPQKSPFTKKLANKKSLRSNRATRSTQNDDVPRTARKRPSA